MFIYKEKHMYYSLMLYLIEKQHSEKTWNICPIASITMFIADANWQFKNVTLKY